MTTATPIEVKLPHLHDSQLTIAKHPARFKVVCCGRRWGKTVLGIVTCLRSALKGGRVWWVAPSYKQALEGWQYLQRLIVKMPASMAKTHVSELLVTFAGGGSIQVRTGDNPDNLRGAGLDGVVLDEAATMKPEAWHLVLRPALADRKGWALFIGTPRHFNWFYDLFTYAEEDESGAWEAWQRPSWDNPYLDEAEIEAAREDMRDRPEDFDQEYGASFTAVGGAVWRQLAANRHLYLRPMPHDLIFRRKGVGLDWGTTKEHQAAVVSGGLTSTGAVWVTSCWLSPDGEDSDWFNEAERCRKDYGGTMARVDRSQSSAKGNLSKMGYTDVEVGVANVEARIGAIGGLIKQRSIYFDINGPGMRELFTDCTNYHRDDEGDIVEERDDSVDGLGYLVKGLTEPKQEVPSAVTLKREQGRSYALKVTKVKV
jgi:hypothetical protein